MPTIEIDNPYGSGETKLVDFDTMPDDATVQKVRSQIFPSAPVVKPSYDFTKTLMKSVTPAISPHHATPTDAGGLFMDPSKADAATRRPMQTSGHAPTKGQVWDDSVQAYVPKRFYAPPKPDVPGLKRDIEQGDSPGMAAFKDIVSGMVSPLAAIGKEIGPKPDAFSGYAPPGSAPVQDTQLPNGDVMTRQYADQIIRSLQAPIDPRAWQNDPKGTALTTAQYLIPYLPKWGRMADAALLYRANEAAAGAYDAMPGRPRTMAQPPQPGYRIPPKLPETSISEPTGVTTPESPMTYNGGMGRPSPNMPPGRAAQDIQANGPPGMQSPSPMAPPEPPAVPTPEPLPPPPVEPSPRIGMSPHEEDKYAGSINVTRTGLDPEQIQRVRDRAESLGLNDKTPVTDAHADELSKALGLSYDDFRGRRAGMVPEPPEGFSPEQWQKTWVRAVRGLHDQSEIDVTRAMRDVADAEDVHGDNPTPGTQKDIEDTTLALAAANDNADLMTVHRSKLGAVSGVGLQGHVAPSYGLKGEGYQNALRDAPRLDESLGQPTEPTTVTPKAEGPVIPDVPNPKTGKVRERTVSDSDFNAALARIKALPDLHGAVGKFMSDEGGYTDVSVLSGAVKDLVTIGKYHIETGLRSFDKWRAAVEKTVGSKIDDAHAQYVFQLSRAALKQDVSDKQEAALKPLFVDQLENSLGRKGAAQFLHDLSPEARDKMIKGTSLKGHEKEIQDAWDKNVPQRNKGASQAALGAVKAIVKDSPRSQAIRRAAADRLNATRRAKNAPTQGPPDEDAAFEQMLAKRVKGGAKGAAAVHEDLKSDALGRSVKDKLMRGAGDETTEAEQRRLAQAIDRHQKTAPRTNGNQVAAKLSSIVRDAHAGRLGYDSQKAAVREQLLRYAKKADGTPDEAKIKAIAHDLASVGENDTDALVKVLNKHAGNKDWLQQFILGNLLSGPETGEKIMIAHPSTISLEETRRFMEDPRESRAGVRAAVANARTEGLKSAWDAVAKGPVYRQLQGKDPFHPQGAKIQTEQSDIAKPVLRLHQAYYNFMAEYNYARGLHFHAWQEAAGKGLKGAERDAYVQNAMKSPSRALKQRASDFAAEEAQTNRNMLVDKTRAMFRSGGKVGQTAGNVLLPVLGVPMNAIGRSIEMATGSFMSKQLARAYKELHPTASAAQIAAYQRKVLMRGRIGMGLAVAGGVGGAAGLVNPSDEKKGRYAPSVNFRGREFELPAGNVGAMVGLGAKGVDLYKQYHELPTSLRPSGLEAAGQLVEGIFADVPYGRTMDNWNAIQEYAKSTPGSERPVNRVIAGTINEVTPYSGFLGNMSKWIDPQHAVRREPESTVAKEWLGHLPPWHQMQPPVLNKATGQPYQASILHTRPQERLTPAQEAHEKGYQQWQDAINRAQQALMHRGMSPASALYHARQMIGREMGKNKSKL